MKIESRGCSAVGSAISVAASVVARYDGARRVVDDGATLTETLWRHGTVAFNPRYGTLGLLAFPSLAPAVNRLAGRGE